MARPKASVLGISQRRIEVSIDDASHLYEEVREASNITFPYLKPGGRYVVEHRA